MKYTAKIKMSLMSVMLLTLLYTQAQDTRWSQPLNSPLAMNPAMMGLTNDFRIILNYRNQWASINKGYTSYSGTLLYPLFLGSKKDTSSSEGPRNRIDFGLNVTDDKSGGFNRINATLSIGYGLRLDKSNWLHAALNFGYMNYQLDAIHQTFDEQFVQGTFDVNNPTGESLNLSKGAPDVGLGFMWHYAPENNKLQAFAGISAYHVNQPNLTVISGRGTLPARINAQAGVKIIGNKMDFTPVLFYNYQGPHRQFGGGLTFAYKFGEMGSKGKLVVGTWFKEKDAVVLHAGYEHKYFFFTYSYDFGISKLARTTKGLMTHEVGLGFKLINVGAKKGIKTLNFL
jgi:type IX secretion system PorP/SprF family membrane protein